MVRKVDVGHYAAHCQDDLAQVIHTFHKRGFNKDALTVKAMRDVIAKAPKFAINFGEVIAAGARDGFPGMPNELHLPYDTIVVETPAWYDPTVDPTHTPCDKTIAIAEQGDGYIMVTAVSRVRGPSEWMWVPCRSGAKLMGVPEPLPSDVKAHGVIPNVSILVTEVLKETGFTYDEKYKLTEQERAERMYQDILMEAQAVSCLLWALEQRHATVERHDPPAKLNKKREARGALPFDEYHVLTIEPLKPAHEPVDSGMKYPDRMSPREHKRSGHWRHFKSGNRVWIKDTIINEGVGGAVWKDYRVRK